MVGESPYIFIYFGMLELAVPIQLLTPDGCIIFCIIMYYCEKLFENSLE